jgi:hypothetical protein
MREYSLAVCMTNSHSARGEMERAPRNVWRDFSLNCLYKKTSAGSSVENNLESNLGVSGGESTCDRGSFEPNLVQIVSSGERTYNERLYSFVTSSKHPKRPSCHPPVTFDSSLRQYLIGKEFL